MRERKIAPIGCKYSVPKRSEAEIARSMTGAQARPGRGQQEEVSPGPVKAYPWCLILPQAGA